MSSRMKGENRTDWRETQTVVYGATTNTRQSNHEIHGLGDATNTLYGATSSVRKEPNSSMLQTNDAADVSPGRRDLRADEIRSQSLSSWLPVPCYDASIPLDIVKQVVIFSSGLRDKNETRRNKRGEDERSDGGESGDQNKESVTQGWCGVKHSSVQLLI